MGRELREQLQAYVATLNLPQTQVDRLVDSLRHRFRYDAVASADAVLPINQTQWQRLIRQETRMADLTPKPWPDSVSMVYRQRVCLAPEPGPVTLGVVTEADGSLRGDPAVLQSSGYGAVDDKARAALAEQDFPAAETIQAYILTVEPELDYGRRPCLDPNPDT